MKRLICATVTSCQFAEVTWVIDFVARFLRFFFPCNSLTYIHVTGNEPINPVGFAYFLFLTQKNEQQRTIGAGKFLHVNEIVSRLLLLLIYTYL
jgi:hypothetical protein